MLPEGKCRYIDGQIYPDGNFFVLDTQHIKHNGSELKSALNGISTDISNKVDKETGKGLSTNDYTTAEKNKLSGIEANANNYVHPTTSGNKHIPSGGSSGKILGWSADGTAAWVDPTGGGGGSVDTVSVNGTTYSPDANGDVALPNYPTVIELGETSSTAYRGDRGKAAYDHATDSSRLTTATASGLYKVASTSEGHIASLAAVVKSDITSLGIPSSDTNTYVSSASFADNTSSSTANPLKMTLSRSGSLTTSVTATLPKVSSSTAGVVPKGASVSSQSQSTKFLREDGSWAAPSYSSSSTFTISRYSSSYTVNTETWKSNGMAWFTILIKNSNQINANTSTIPAYVPSDLKPKGSRDINLVCDVDNKYCRAWITGGSQYIYIRSLENIPANSNIRITGCYPY